MRLHIIIYLFVFCLSGVSVLAQQKSNCGTPTNIKDYARFMDKSAVSRMASDPIRIKLYVVNFDRTTTFDPGVEIPANIALMNSYYAPLNICFELIGYRTVDNSDLSVMRLYEPETVAQLHQYRLPNVMTMFIHFGLFSTPNNSLAGTAYNIPNTYFSVKSSFLDDFTSAHEAGHCLGLFHTFHGNPGVEDETGCEELATGSNSSSCGDFVVDTRPDPYGLANATINAACAYNGTAKDSKGNLYSNPPLNNVMAYWGDNASCNITTLTAGQNERARLSVVGPFAPLLFYQVDQSNITFNGGTISGGLFSRATIGTLQANNYKITNAAGGFTAKRVTLTPGSHVRVTAEETNFVIKPVTCQ